jgi:hypothetical protein
MKFEVQTSISWMITHRPYPKSDYKEINAVAVFVSSTVVDYRSSLQEKLSHVAASNSTVLRNLLT